jgi:hypothetical protein
MRTRQWSTLSFGFVVAATGCTEPLDALSTETVEVAPRGAAESDPERAKRRAVSGDDLDDDAGTVRVAQSDDANDIWGSPGLAAASPTDAGTDTGPVGGAGGAPDAAAADRNSAPVAGGSSVSDAGTADGGMENFDIVATWYGPVIDTLGPRFNACVRVMQVSMPGPAGTASYLGSLLNCRGELTFVEVVDRVYSFTELISSGTGCMPAGRIDMIPNADGTLDYNWFRPNVALPQEEGTLVKVAECP